MQEYLAPFITLLFNCDIVEGFPPQWTMSAIHKGGDPMELNICGTIMIGHAIANLYGQIVEVELSSLKETIGS